MAMASFQWAVALVVVFLALWLGSLDYSTTNSGRNATRPWKWLWPSTTAKPKSSTMPKMADDDFIHETPRVTAADATSKSSLTIYAIGDLHGDVECARQWVARTNVIIDVETTNQKIWKDETTRLVFMGDYVDKGITSKQTVEFVKSLTETFPNYVTAIMGNHELELLRDRTETLWGNGNAGYYQLVYGAVHPAEYLNFLSDEQRDAKLDEMVVDALYNASLHVYGTGKHRSVYLSPDLSFPGSILHLIPEPALRETVQSRLKLYQTAYLNAFRTGTVLGDWLEKLPIAAVVDTTLFVHGGLAPKVTQQFLSTVQDISDMNDLFRQHSTESKLAEFLQSTTAGQICYHLATFRGNHKDDKCEELVLPETITRLSVGHTPGAVVRNPCRNGQFLALDSSLSRWFRNSGNQYCKGDAQQQVGSFACQQKSNHCQGEIARIQGDVVEILSITGK